MICQTCQLKQTKGGRKECTNCRQKKWRKNNPFKYHYKNKKNRAKQQGKEFTLTLEQFKQIWLEHPEKWKDKRDNPTMTKWELDRKDGSKGYTFENCQILSKQENIEKYYNGDTWETDLPDVAPF